MANYGKTYWGKTWLSALSNIDYSNRLPRGRSYASRGAVLEIKINATKILASVAGSRRTPYSVTIGVPEFNAGEKEKITDILSSHPAFLASLLNRKLPRNLLDITQKEGIALFSSKWDDLAMRCSCPDWAVPCKHVAAVIYMIANQIDLNPLLVLEMHGYDVEAALSKEDVDIKEERSEVYTAMEDLTKPFQENISTSDKVDAEFEPPAPDLSVLPNVGDRYLELLPDKTVFYDKKIKKELIHEVRQVRKQADRILADQDAPDLGLHRVIDAHIHLNRQFSNPKAVLIFEDNELELPLVDLLEILMDMEEQSIEALCTPLHLIHGCYRVARSLLVKGMVIPDLMKTGDHWLILWQPASREEHVAGILDELEQALPPDLMTITSAEERVISAGLRAFYVTTAMITEIINTILLMRNGSIHGDDITALFLNGTPVKEDEQVSREQLNSIQLWLKKLHVANQKRVPVIQIEASREHPEPLFLLSIQVLDRGDGSMVPWQKFNSNAKYRNHRIRVLKDLMSLREYVPDLAELVNDDDVTHLKYDSKAFEKVLLELIPVLRLLGIEVLLPKSLKKLVKPSPTVQVDKTSSGESNGWISLEKLLTFDWKVAVGDDIIDQKEFMRLVEGKRGIVRIRDRYLHLKDNDLQKLKKQLNNPPKLNHSKLLRIFISEEYEGASAHLSDSVEQLRQQWLSVNEVSEPENLQATLRPYQQRGFQWLYKNSRLGFGSILADDMGLGKTVQAIALMAKIKEEGWLNNQQKALVVVPTSLITNWKHEIQRFAPELQAGIHHGTNRSLEDLDDCEVCITS